ncbi:hypothetical protein OC834_004870 [Tilletia horrida]|uniref:Cytochrome b561 domain-containing protein n=1 Tax=Tilletia horrida TaxID=155126 RepID=A0AAN6GG26_9BASI|nr:hypothetical protein OC835_007117 [Tilletia horrida]KAK0526269.1 hypothetical protein OC834_004870 [Tilletia horrida]KAK0535317.1 hypothetical protein OC842_002359 [Tilletia horrida]KAK0559281.1 hypothetical protein OC844_004513 [Tilletia horrida]
MKICKSAILSALTLATYSRAAKFGDRSCSSPATSSQLCVSAIYDDEALSVKYKAEYTGSSIGWIGVGQGEQMAGANMMVGWPTPDGKVTLSQRTTSSHFPPTAQQITAKSFIPDVAGTSTNSSATVLSWTFPVAADFASAKTAHIWAVSAVNPSSADASASLTKHNHRGFIIFDFTKPLETATNSSQPAQSDSGTSSSTSSTQEQIPKIRDLSLRPVRLFLAHVIIMSIAWMGLVPAGILIGRYGRTYFSSSWFKIHRAVQISAVVLITIGFALGVSGVTDAGIPHFDTAHQKLGLAMFILVIIQAFWGQIGHVLNRSKNIRLLNYPHIVIGTVLFFGLSLWQIRLGLDLWLWQPPKAVGDVFFPIWFGLITAAWLLGMILLPRQVKQGQDDREKIPLSTGSASP